jgi:hypothetical protein
MTRAVDDRVAPPDDPIERAAHDVAEGRPVDWAALGRLVQNSEAREQLNNLRVIEGIAELHRSGTETSWPTRRSIVTLTRRLCPYTSSFRIDELDVRLEDGAKMQLVLKNLSAEAMLDHARARPAFLYEPLKPLTSQSGSASPAVNACPLRPWPCPPRNPGHQTRRTP